MWSQEAAEIRLGWLGEKHPLSVASQKDLNALREMTGGGVVRWSGRPQGVARFLPTLEGLLLLFRDPLDRPQQLQL